MSGASEALLPAMIREKMAEFIPVEPFDIVIMGGNGDLSRRKLLPALFHRHLDGQIHPSCRIVAVARQNMSRADFVDFAEVACRKATQNWDESTWTDFASRLFYQIMDATDKNGPWDKIKKHLTRDDRICVFYLATTPRIYVDICDALKANGLNGPWSRLVLEKPIGTDLASAREINRGVGAVFPENSIYRIDHYLGKETVQNLLVLRFANTLFEPVWSRNTIDHVQITVAESLGLEGRADYFDRSGAVRDMIQNHLLQLLCLTAMEPPNELDADSVRTEKIKVLKALQRFTPNNVKQNSVRAQHKAGLVDGKAVPGYLENLSSGESSTETFVALKVEVANWRWAGVPFYLRTGKRMESRRSEIVVQFKPTPHRLFENADRAPNQLVIRLQPDEGMRLYMQIKEPGPGRMRLKSLPLNLAYAEEFLVRYPDAYERLLMDVIRGNLSLFMRSDEVEEAWRWVDALLQAWEDSDQPLETYQAGTDGPLQSAMLIDRDGRNWWNSK